MNYFRQCKIAIANIKGGPLAPKLKGRVMMEEVPGGTMVYVYIEGLPPYKPAQGDQAPIGPHGFHIHENGDCTVGDPKNPFQGAG